ncbi:hypothetical protein VTI28DRAFT_2824 [Corynascus sepedonium]
MWLAQIQPTCFASQGTKKDWGSDWKAKKSTSGYKKRGQECAEAGRSRMRFLLFDLSPPPFSVVRLSLLAGTFRLEKALFASVSVSTRSACTQNETKAPRRLSRMLHLCNLDRCLQEARGDCASPVQVMAWRRPTRVTRKSGVGSRSIFPKALKVNGRRGVII